MERRFEMKINLLLFIYCIPFAFCSLLFLGALFVIIVIPDWLNKLAILIPLLITFAISAYNFIHIKTLLWIKHSYKTEPKEVLDYLSDKLKTDDDVRNRSRYYQQSKYSGLFIRRLYDDAHFLLEKMTYPTKKRKLVKK